jgi:hypothetical protein
MTAAESLLVFGHLLVIFGALGFVLTLANAVVDWFDGRRP